MFSYYMFATTHGGVIRKKPDIATFNKNIKNTQYVYPKIGVIKKIRY